MSNDDRGIFDQLGQFLNQNPQAQQQYQQFADQYDNDPSQISDEEAARRYRELMAQADPNSPAVQQANQQAFSQMSEQDREALAQQFQQATQDPNRPYQGYPQQYTLQQAAQPQQLGQMAQQAAKDDPDLLESLVGPNSPLASTGAKLALAGAAAFLAKQFLSKR